MTNTDTPAAGHNVGDARLRSIVERIENLEEQRKAIGGDIRDIYAEAKSGGYDVKVLRKLIRDRAQDAADLEEQETLLDVYKRALGMFVDTPLGEAAVARETRRRAAA